MGGVPPELDDEEIARLERQLETAKEGREAEFTWHDIRRGIMKEMGWDYWTWREQPAEIIIDLMHEMMAEGNVRARERLKEKGKGVTSPGQPGAVSREEFEARLAGGE